MFLEIASAFRRISFIILTSLLTAAIFSGLATEAVAQPASPVATTQYGKVKGLVEDDVEKFLGIPYAMPPVGQLRWTAPLEPIAWSGTRDANQYANECPQGALLGDFADASTTEDCLYLNVFAPANKEKKKLPVMVWIYGGGMVVGQSTGYDGSALAMRGDVIVVSMNYRTNVFGFLAHPSFDEGGKSANFGLLDQQAALKWVQKNISAFGGDVNNVTIFGESAGGYSVLTHMMSPLSKGLFHKAIVESGGYGYGLSNWTLEQAEAKAKEFAKTLGCEDQSADCLRKIPVEKILSLSQGFTVPDALMIIDGYSLLKPQKQALESGDFTRVPILMGGNKNEWRWSVATQETTAGKVISDHEYGSLIEERYGDLASIVASKYPLSKYSNAREAWGDLQGDPFMICSSYNAIKALSNHAPVWAFEFADTSAPFYDPPRSFSMGAYHTAEIQYLFRGWKGGYDGSAPSLNEQQMKLSDQMISYWTTFARSGNPNAPDLPNWPKFTNNEVMLSLNQPNPATITSFKNDHNCDFWNAIVERAVKKLK